MPFRSREVSPHRFAQFLRVFINKIEHFQSINIEGM